MTLRRLTRESALQRRLDRLEHWREAREKEALAAEANLADEAMEIMRQIQALLENQQLHQNRIPSTTDIECSDNSSSTTTTTTTTSETRVANIDSTAPARRPFDATMLQKGSKVLKRRNASVMDEQSSSSSSPPSRPKPVLPSALQLQSVKLRKGDKDGKPQKSRVAGEKKNKAGGTSQSVAEMAAALAKARAEKGLVGFGNNSSPSSSRSKESVASPLPARTRLRQITSADIRGGVAALGRKKRKATPVSDGEDGKGESEDDEEDSSATGKRRSRRLSKGAKTGENKSADGLPTPMDQMLKKAVTNKFAKANALPASPASTAGGWSESEIENTPLPQTKTRRRSPTRSSAAASGKKKSSTPAKSASSSKRNQESTATRRSTRSSTKKK
jgi:hypothetical protein